MKHPSTRAIRRILQRVQNQLSVAIVLLAGTLFILPATGISQTTGGPTSPGPGGAGNPDNPLGVPFDGRLNLLLLISGVALAVMVLKRLQKQQRISSK